MDGIQKIKGSFRDPSGYVYTHGDKILRTINDVFRPDWEEFHSSGLSASLIEKGFIVKFTETEPLPDSWKTLIVDKLACISFPYEWSFSQLKDAAVLTLEIQKEAIARGMTLKDASAYNVQFQGSNPIFIDLLSFESRDQDAPWQAYRQFCMHFLAPLAIYGAEPELGRLSTLWIDGIPLDIAWKLLPIKSNLSIGLQMHLHLHSIAERKYSDARKVKDKIKTVKLNTNRLKELIDSLIRTINAIPSSSVQGDWTDYYNDTNYTESSEASKIDIIESVIKDSSGGIALDLGANTGKYSELLAKYFDNVVAADIDPQAVDVLYRRLKSSGINNILPLVIDLANPSPAIGWACEERPAWTERWQADCVCALALTHHLFFTNRIPWEKQASFFANLLKQDGRLIMEFVPKEDSQVQRLLAARDDIFPDYNFESCLQDYLPYFTKEAAIPICDSSRILLVMRKK